MWVRFSLLVFVVGCVDIDSANGVDSDDVTVEHEASALTTPVGTVSGRATGLAVTALGILNVIATPDTNIRNPDNLIRLNVDLPAPLTLSLHDTVFSVTDTTSSGAFSVSDTATATTNTLRLQIPGLIDLTAITLRAQASSRVEGGAATATGSGSIVQHLIVNGRLIGDIGAPTTITIALPILNIPLATISLLETTVTTSPDQRSATASVNALHVKVLDGSVDAVVAHAESTARLPPVCGCH